MHIYNTLISSFLERQISRKEVIQTTKDTLNFNNICRQSCCLRDNVEKYGEARQAAHNNKAHALCKLGNSEYVILIASSRQTWLHECSLILRYKCVTCLVGITWHTSPSKTLRVRSVKPSGKESNYQALKRCRLRWNLICLRRHDVVKPLVFLISWYRGITRLTNSLSLMGVRNWIFPSAIVRTSHYRTKEQTSERWKTIRLESSKLGLNSCRHVKMFLGPTPFCYKPNTFFKRTALL